MMEGLRFAPISISQWGAAQSVLVKAIGVEGACSAQMPTAGKSSRSARNIGGRSEKEPTPAWSLNKGVESLDEEDKGIYFPIRKSPSHCVVGTEDFSSSSVKIHFHQGHHM